MECIKKKLSSKAAGNILILSGWLQKLVKHLYMLVFLFTDIIICIVSVSGGASIPAEQIATL